MNKHIHTYTHVCAGEVNALLHDKKKHLQKMTEIEKYINTMKNNIKMETDRSLGLGNEHYDNSHCSRYYNCYHYHRHHYYYFHH